MNATEAKSYVEANWHILKGEAKKRWGQLTHNDLEEVSGSHEKLVGLLMKKLHWTKEKSQEEVKNFYEKAKGH